MKVDLRILQILFLSSFLLYGIQVLQWDVSYEGMALLIMVSLLTQALFCWAFGLSLSALKSAIITSLGIALLLRTNHVMVYGLAGFFAIGSKYIFRFKNKHFFNPANFGIIFVLLFMGKAWISPSQWGSSAIAVFIIASMAILILAKLPKIDLAITFFLVFFGLDFLYNIVYKGWDLDFLTHNLTNGATIIFTFFMITDPSSTPNHKIGRILWVILVAVLAFYLQYFEYLRGAPLYSLFILAVCTPIIDSVFKSIDKFSWDSTESRELFTNDV